KEGEWIPNEYGGRENLAAISLLKEFNEQVHLRFPGALTVAEESTAWTGVSRPTYLGGLGFSLKWNMGWMNDTLRYMRHERIYRAEPALYEDDFTSGGFEWIDCHNHEDSTLSYIRRAKHRDDYLVICNNFTPVVREGHRLGVPEVCWYEEIFSSDSAYYSGG